VSNIFNLVDIVTNGIAKFLANFFEELITLFATTLANIMSSSLNVLQIPLVENGIKYAQALAFTILVLKATNEAFQTYILYENGDPDADPGGLLVRTAQATAIIATLPWIVMQIFTFGTKLALDVAGLGTGKTGIADWAFLTTVILDTGGSVIALFCIALAIMLLIVAIQATIRGAELALMAVLGPIMALNITSTNRSVWSAWFKQVIIVCTAQAIQIFLLQGALGLITSGSVSSNGLLLVFGWLWVTIKSPKYIQQFAYSTGFTGAIGGTAKQTGSMYVMRKMMVK
jgi:hypothetical protein